MVLHFNTHKFLSLKKDLCHIITEIGTDLLKKKMFKDEKAFCIITLVSFRNLFDEKKNHITNNDLCKD